MPGLPYFAVITEFYRKETSMLLGKLSKRTHSLLTRLPRFPFISIGSRELLRNFYVQMCSEYMRVQALQVVAVDVARWCKLSESTCKNGQSSSLRKGQLAIARSSCIFIESFTEWFECEIAMLR